MGPTLVVDRQLSPISGLPGKDKAQTRVGCLFTPAKLPGLD